MRRSIALNEEQGRLIAASKLNTQMTKTSAAVKTTFPRQFATHHKQIAADLATQLQMGGNALRRSLCRVRSY